MKSELLVILNRLGGSVDRLNDRITSYRLMLYFLLALLGWAVIGSFFGKVPYSDYEILLSAGWLGLICWGCNYLLSKVFNIPANKESSLISALILALIMSPAVNLHGYAVLAAAGLAGMATKYLLVFHKSHVFNPAAAGAFVAGLLLGQPASWWVGTGFITPLALIGGILILRKTKRYMMVATFLAVYGIYLVINSHFSLGVHLVTLEVFSTPLLFFAIVMLTEPLTSPDRENIYLPYAVIVGVLYSATLLHVSPEEALLIGNLFSLAAAPKRRFQLTFQRKIQEAEEIYSYVFSRPAELRFSAGQYMEWTLWQPRSDSRGNRRYLTIASAPTEPEIMITVRFPKAASTFKRRLDTLKPGESILAAHVTGEFILSKNQPHKLAFLAGGVGITPFRSIIKELLDMGDKIDAALIYSASSSDQIAFRGLFDQARRIGLKTTYITDRHIKEADIKHLLHDYQQRTFYISGPYSFVQAMEQSLLRLKVAPSQIKQDYFPGYG
ncbi:MAG TPA: hypothetical protein VFP32_01490 [Candidatus Saccharimonadales bacterium]|nr:hypothetical protein [Candidatus Saccharimonadales bacterium]